MVLKLYELNTSAIVVYLREQHQHQRKNGKLMAKWSKSEH